MSRFPPRALLAASAGWVGPGRMGALVTMMAVALWACEAQPRALEQGSRSPSSPRVPAGASFEPQVGDFTTIEVFDVLPDRTNAAAELMVSQVMPVIRARGGLREVWMMRDETNARFIITSVWADPRAFQQWQMSQQRLEAYRPLGPFLSSQPSVQTVSLIGVIARPAR